MRHPTLPIGSYLSLDKAARLSPWHPRPLGQLAEGGEEEGTSGPRADVAHGSSQSLSGRHRPRLRAFPSTMQTRGDFQAGRGLLSTLFSCGLPRLDARWQASVCMWAHSPAHGDHVCLLCPVSPRRPAAPATLPVLSVLPTPCASPTGVSQERPSQAIRAFPGGYFQNSEVTGGPGGRPRVAPAVCPPTESVLSLASTCGHLQPGRWAYTGSGRRVRGCGPPLPGAPVLTPISPISEAVSRPPSLPQDV